MNYYNEWEKFPAQWLRELAADGLIPEGVVDERSITELRPEDLAGFNQCHFFAGIGGWPRALELAGIPADFPIWSGSCPCQPFSTAGKRHGAADERNLWHIWFELIRVCRPAAVVGEQVASAIAVGWLDRVLDDLESAGYETWACVLPACSVGAPHIRSRLFWAGVRVALPNGNGWEQRRPECAGQGREPSPVDGGAACGLADANGAESASGKLRLHSIGGSGHRDEGEQERAEIDRLADAEHPQWGEVCLDGENGRNGQDNGRQEAHGEFGTRGEVCRLGDMLRKGLAAIGTEQAVAHPADQEAHFIASIPILCRDGKTRRIPAPQSDVQPIFNGLSGVVVDSWLQSLTQIEGEIKRYAASKGSSGNEVLLALWKIACSDQVFKRSPGVAVDVQKAQVLLFALCELARNPKFAFNSTASDIREIQERTMRILWGEGVASCPSHKPRLDGSSPGKPEDALHSLPPRAAQETEPEVPLLRNESEEKWDVPEALPAMEEIWESICAEIEGAWNDERVRNFMRFILATSAFPLAGKVPGRVGLLRGYGNAIVPQVTAAFLRAVLRWPSPSAISSAPCGRAPASVHAATAVTASKCPMRSITGYVGGMSVGGSGLFIGELMQGIKCVHATTHQQ